VGTGARFDADPMGLRNPDAASVSAYGWLLEDETTRPLKLSAIAADDAEAQAIATRLEAVPEVARTVWLGDLVPEDQDDKLAIVDVYWPSMDYAVNGEPVALADPRPADARSVAERLAGQGGAADALPVVAVRLGQARVGLPPLRRVFWQGFPAFPGSHLAAAPGGLRRSPPLGDGGSGVVPRGRGAAGTDGPADGDRDQHHSRPP